MTSIKMYLLGVLCLVAFTTAVPVIRELSAFPGDVTVHDLVLRTNSPREEDAQKGEHEENKDENEAEPPYQVVIMSVPEPPILPPFHQSILAELINQKEDSKVDDDKKKDKNDIASFINSLMSLLGIKLPVVSLPSVLTRYPQIIYPGYEYVIDITK